MKVRGPNPLRIFAYFVLCLLGSMMVQAETGLGAPLDVFWLVAFLVLVLVFGGSLSSRSKASREALESRPSRARRLRRPPRRASVRRVPD